MKRHTDHEGRAESAGPLWEASRRLDEGFAELDRTRTALGVPPGAPVLGDELFPSATQLSELRRDLGMSRAANAAEKRAPGWEEQALADLRTFARTHQRFAVEDFRAAFPPPPGVNPKALGAVVRRAARERIVIADGYVAVKCSNMSPRVAWKSLVFEERKLSDG